MFGKVVNLLYKYFVKTNVFISLCAIAFYFSGLLLLTPFEVKIVSEETLLVFCSTLLIYNVSQSKFGILHYLKTKSLISIVLFAGTLVPVIILAWNLKFNTLIYFTHLGLISILYNSPLFNAIKYLPLRSIPLIKVFVIAYIWASIGSFLPALVHNMMPGAEVYLFFASQFFFILAITLPFDIRDFYSDFRTELKTLPGTLGIRKTKILAYVALSIHFLLLFSVLQTIWISVPLVLLTFLLIRNASASKPDHYYTFFIDGLIILQFLIFYLHSIYE